MRIWTRTCTSRLNARKNEVARIYTRMPFRKKGILFHVPLSSAVNLEVRLHFNPRRGRATNSTIAYIAP